MVNKIKKETLFIFSLLFISVMGRVSGYLDSNFSKENSVFFEIAHADTPPPPGGDVTGGSGGCSASGDTGDAGDAGDGGDA